MGKSFYGIGLAIVLFATASLHGAPEDRMVFTDFESLSGTTVPIGSSPATAIFTGLDDPAQDGFIGVAGQSALYFPGELSAWMVLPGGRTGVVHFPESNASLVEFYFRNNPAADGNSIITAFDDGDSVIGAPVVVNGNGGFELLQFAGSIDHITIQNNSSGGQLMNSIEHFGFDIVPEPTSLALLLVGGVLLVRRRRPRLC